MKPNFTNSPAQPSPDQPSRHPYLKGSHLKGYGDPQPHHGNKKLLKRKSTL